MVNQEALQWQRKEGNSGLTMIWYHCLQTSLQVKHVLIGTLPRISHNMTEGIPERGLYCSTFFIRCSNRSSRKQNGQYFRKRSTMFPLLHPFVFKSPSCNSSSPRLRFWCSKGQSPSCFSVIGTSAGLYLFVFKSAFANILSSPSSSFCATGATTHRINLLSLHFRKLGAEVGF